MERGLSHKMQIISTFRGYYMHFVGKSMFRGCYPNFVDIYVLRGYYLHFVEISMFRIYYLHFVEISTSRGYYSHFLDIIYIDHIMSYLSHNVCPIFHIYSFSESDWCISSKFYRYMVGTIQEKWNQDHWNHPPWYHEGNLFKYLTRDRNWSR